jgi:hypothetical protein
MISPRLIVLSWAALASAFASAGWIVIDIYDHRCRQHMKLMEAV